MATYPQQTSTYTQLDKLYQLQSVLEIMTKNFEYYLTAGKDSAIKTINADLYALAVEYYGDATLWNYIAQANNLFDPLVDGELTLTIPPTPGLNTGGVITG